MRKSLLLSWAAWLLPATVVLGGGPPPPADCDRDPSLPRVVIVTLDGVAHRTFMLARKRGAFEGWPAGRPLVSTFPSVTNVAFAAIYRPFGMTPIAGYEMQYYDADRNDVIGGGPINYSKRAYGWRDYYQVMSRTTWEKKGVYLNPNKKVRNTMEQLAEAVLGTDREVVVAHVATTDPLAHFRGDERVIEALLDVSAALGDLKKKHRKQRGRELEYVLLSDHGNTKSKVRFDDGIRDRLRDAGLRVTDSLQDEGDIVAPTYGVVSFGVLFTADANAETAARAVVGKNGIDLAAWISEPGRIRVISAGAEAEVHWDGAYGARRIGYASMDGDPLRMAPVVARLTKAGAVDDEGLAGEDDWFAESALEDYPDAPRRLIDALSGSFVSNAAAVVLSFEEGYSWGVYPARVAAHLLGGKLEGTHGGLDRESSHGFFLTDAPEYPVGSAVRADRALSPWSHLADCILPSELDGDPDQEARDARVRAEDDEGAAGAPSSGSTESGRF